MYVCCKITKKRMLLFSCVAPLFEGKLLGLEPNQALRCEETGEIRVLGLEDFTSLLKPLAEKYARKFQTPELMLWNGQRLVIIPL